MTQTSLSQRFIRASLIGASGLAVALAITLSDRAFAGQWGFVRCATAGAFLAGLVFAGSFGRPGHWGWFRAGLGYGGATVLGAIIAVFLLPLDAALMQLPLLGMVPDLLSQAMMGPLYVTITALNSPWVGSLWLGALGGAIAFSARPKTHAAKIANKKAGS